MKPGTALPPLRATRVLDQVRERLRYAHFSLSTERSYVYWVRWFVRFHGLRHPRQMGAAEVEGFLTWLANRHGASVSTHRQALSALVFLYKQVLGIDLPWLQEIGRPRVPKRLPVVMSRIEVQHLLQATTGQHQLVFRLLYGSGMRKMEALRLRVKDVDFDRSLIVVREGKGNKDRITMLPSALVADLQQLLMHYTWSLMGTVAQTSVCNRHHTLEQRLCRWLLLAQDRMHGDDLDITQAFLSEVLGVRREGVTQAEGRLQEAGLIQHRRGHVTILDRVGLGASACDCYAASRRGADRFSATNPKPTMMNATERPAAFRNAAP